MTDSLLLKMRQAGWFDILVYALIGSIALLLLGAAGHIQYNVQMNNMPEGLTPYEIEQALGWLAKTKGSFTLVGGAFLAATIVGFVLLAIFCHLSDKVSFEAKQKAGKVKVALQYIAALAITLVMLFPIYWMVISSLKTSQELLLPVPTLWPREFQWQNFPNVLQRAPFVRYLFNTLITTFFMMLGQIIFGVLAAMDSLKEV